MRITMRFIGVLAAVLLIALPVMGISAQGGAEVASPVIVETGTGGEIQALTQGLLYKGSGYVPAGVTTPVTPEGMPQTGGGEQAVTMVSTWVWDGFDWVFLTIPAEPTLALPQTGRSGEVYVPSNLPAPGETELTIGELTPSALPETSKPGDIYIPSNLPAPGETELTIGELCPIGAAGDGQLGRWYLCTVEPARPWRDRVDHRGTQPLGAAGNGNQRTIHRVCPVLGHDGSRWLLQS